MYSIICYGCLITAHGVLSLNKAERTPSFKRACFMLYDLKLVHPSSTYHQFQIMICESECGLLQCNNHENVATSWIASRSDKVRFCNILCRYALLCKPTSDEWTENLRESFLRGHKSFLKLLKMMQVSYFQDFFMFLHPLTSFWGRVLDWRKVPLELYLIDLHCPKNSLHVLYIVFSITMKVNFSNGIDRAWMK